MIRAFTPRSGSLIALIWALLVFWPIASGPGSGHDRAALAGAVSDTHAILAALPACGITAPENRASGAEAEDGAWPGSARCPLPTGHGCGATPLIRDAGPRPPGRLRVNCARAPPAV